VRRKHKQPKHHHVFKNRLFSKEQSLQLNPFINFKDCDNHIRFKSKSDKARQIKIRREAVECFLVNQKIQDRTPQEQNLFYSYIKENSERFLVK
jgi:hypothetical protein